jgi:hypothetical protein
MRSCTGHALWIAGTVTLAACGSGAVDAIGLAPGGLSLGLVAHWTFDEGAGSTLHDSSDNHHDGTIDGSAWSWLAQGRFGSALHLEQGDYVAVDGFPDATSGWTVSAWVQIASEDVSTDDVTLISTEDLFKGGWEMNLAAQPSPQHYHFGFWAGPGSTEYAHCECLDCLHPGDWQHVVAVVDGSALTLSFYLDGVPQAHASIRPARSPGVPTLYMGRWSVTDPARFLVGSLDDVAIWNRPLVDAEVVALTQAPAP